MKERIAIWQILLNVCEAVVPITGLLVWRLNKDIRVKAFIIYSLFIIISELFGRYLKTHYMKEGSVMFYNYLVIPIEFLFLIWFLFSYMQGRKIMYLCILFSFIGIGSQVVDIGLLKDGVFFFSSFSYIICTLLLLITILLFVWQFIQTNSHLHYDKYFVFWVALASLIYYLGSFPLFAFYNYLYNTEKDAFYIYWYISMALNMFMYLLFSIALIWTSTKYKYT